MIAFCEASLPDPHQALKVGKAAENIGIVQVQLRQSGKDSSRAVSRLDLNDPLNVPFVGIRLFEVTNNRQAQKIAAFHV